MILVAIGSNLNSKSFGSPEQNCKAAIDMLREILESRNPRIFIKLNLFLNLNNRGL